LKEAYVKTYS
jgi:hypothetical protein